MKSDLATLKSKLLMIEIEKILKLQIYLTTEEFFSSKVLLEAFCK